MPKGRTDWSGGSIRVGAWEMFLVALAAALLAVVAWGGAYGLYFAEAAGMFLGALAVVAVPYFILRRPGGTTVLFLGAACMTAWLQIHEAASTADAVARVALLVLPLVGLTLLGRTLYRRKVASQEKEHDARDTG